MVSSSDTVTCICCKSLPQVHPRFCDCFCTTGSHVLPCNTQHYIANVPTLCHKGCMIRSQVATCWQTYMLTVSCTGSNTASSLRIWEREGCELHALGAALKGLHPVLAWQPSGRHLYAAHPQGQHHRVVLYETNGLEHGGFDVPRTGDTPHTWHLKPRLHCSSTVFIICSAICQQLLVDMFT